PRGGHVRERNVGGPGGPGVRNGPPDGTGPPGYLARAAGTRLEQEPRRERGNRAGEGRPVQSVAPSPRGVLPRHRRVHPADRGAGRRGCGRPGGKTGDLGPAVLPATWGAAGEVAWRRRDVLLPGPGPR